MVKSDQVPVVVEDRRARRAGLGVGSIVNDLVLDPRDPVGVESNFFGTPPRVLDDINPFIAGHCSGVAQKCKSPIAPPHPGPTQQEVLEAAREKQELNTFAVWWNVESQRFQAFLSVQVGAPVQIETLKVDFVNDFAPVLKSAP